MIENGLNTGYNIGKNTGVVNANGDFVLLLDEDIEIENISFLKNILNFHNEFLLRNEKLGFISPVLVDDQKSTTKYYGIYYGVFGKRINKEYDLSKILKQRTVIKLGAFHGGAVFFQKTVWHELGGYDEDYNFCMDDFDLGARSWIMGYSNYLFPIELIHLGKSKDYDKKRFSKKYTSYYEGIAAMAYKNFNTLHLLLFFLCYFPYVVLLNSALIIFRQNKYLVFSPFFALNNFLRRFNKLKIKRKLIQSQRSVNNDVFLSIEPPFFK